MPITTTHWTLLGALCSVNGNSLRSLTRSNSRVLGIPSLNHQPLLIIRLLLRLPWNPSRRQPENWQLTGGRYKKDLSQWLAGESPRNQTKDIQQQHLNGFWSTNHTVRPRTPRSLSSKSTANKSDGKISWRRPEEEEHKATHNFAQW